MVEWGTIDISTPKEFCDVGRSSVTRAGSPSGRLFREKEEGEVRTQE